MKIINGSAQTRQINHKSQQKLLVRKIIDLQTKLVSIIEDLEDGPEFQAMAALLGAREEQEHHIDLLEEAITLQKLKNLKLSSTPSIFTPFPKLPIELRVKIWDYTLETHLQERVHCIYVSRPSSSIFAVPHLLSNQPIHPALHVCRESRSHYQYRVPDSKFSPDLKTYINFNTDILYIPDIEYPPGLLADFIFGPQSCSKEIQRLAMPKSLYCNLPLDHGDHMSIVHVKMRTEMPKWREMLISFEDGELAAGGKNCLDLKTVDLTARQKRKRCERGYARVHAEVLNTMMEMMDPPLEPIPYRFVFLKSRTVVE